MKGNIKLIHVSRLRPFKNKISYRSGRKKMKLSYIQYLMDLMIQYYLIHLHNLKALTSYKIINIS